MNKLLFNIRDLNKIDKYYYFGLFLSIIFCMVLVLAFHVNSPLKIANADYTDDVLNNPQAIVNFNQLVKNDYINFSNGYQQSVYLTDLSNYNGHVFYVRFSFVGAADSSSIHLVNTNGEILNYVAIFGGTSFVDKLYTCNVNQEVYFRTYCGYTTDIVNLNIYDLTAMFGSDNIPSLDDCHDLFVADSYAYNTGTSMSFGAIDSYTRGYNDAVSFTSIQVASSGDFYNTAQNASLTFNDVTYSGVIQQRSNGWLEVNPGNNANWTAFMMPLELPVPGGVSCTFEYSVYNEGGSGAAADRDRYFIIFGLFDAATDDEGNTTASKMYIMATSAKFRTSADQSRYTLTFDMPYTCTRLYIATPYTGGSTWFKDCQISFKYYNFEAVKLEQYNAGYEDATNYFNNLYKVGGAAYNAIYNTGYYDYPNDDHFTFKSLITSAVDVPVQAMTNLFDFEILGVNMKTFYLSVFTLCVVFVVLKMVL